MTHGRERTDGSAVRLGGLHANARLRLRPLTHCAVFDVIGFVELRTSLGYEAAHRVMQMLAVRLEECLPTCTLGRIGRTTIELGFVAPADDADLRATIRDARTALEQPVEVKGVRLALTVACGVARLDAGQIDDHALDRAASALASAQAANEWIVVDGDGGAKAGLNDLDIARALTSALQSDEFELHYQPKLHCRDDAIHSVEALLRWSTPDHGAMPIDRVIAVAERIGMIDALTHWVVERAISDRALLTAAGHAPTIYVNLSGRLLGNRAYVHGLIARVAGQAIGFEITETAVIDDPADAIANVTAMSEAGIRIAIDDYGSGLSSLGYLKQLPAHELKIDRAFIKELVTSHRDPLLVRSSIDLAHALDMEVTAEGVDDPLTLSLLRVMGCDIIQGFLIARALPLGDLLTFLENGATLAGVGRATHALPPWQNGALVKEA